MADNRSEGYRKAINRLLKNLTVRTLWIYVLAALKSNPTYPYQIKKAIVENFNFNPPTVTLYTVIYKLERDGLIVRNSDGTYKVTDLGLKALEEASQLLRELSQRISDMYSN